ncbi:threonine dehydrogenase-like Zn-dependent dehydrogenase [Murinocardiopsis flavida]|uniref:Threonine dehydrogenase-like Zn-dependent dehydrogenase n=1 Tax=Murinocardiopsis flavida TaxID=645275 RepID=A0A2P8DFI9_9ACTN|nr:glucose 1-dehydrogenase [Murinocardiopsis flavida]PSK95981.1 threonine dehydrogenase-like Zn-dependent dehydrogenase [Murinocardiopsis flavida]
MRALTVAPLETDSVRVSEVEAPAAGEGELLVDGIALGICGTDREIARGDYGWAPPGQDRLILGHESLGRVREAPGGSGFAPGDLVVGVVRRPDPEPCGACAHGEFDMCRNGRYTERGIKDRHGFGAQQWTVEADYAVKLDPALERVGVLLEPTTVVTKAWEHIERIGARAWFAPRRVLVTGAGPIGLLAALLGVQRGLEVHVLDRAASGVKPELVAALGASYHTGTIPEVAAEAEPDVVIEATGATAVVLDAVTHTASAGIVCLTGIPAAGPKVGVDTGALNREMVLENDVVFGSVNANLRHFRLAAEALARADLAWLERLITRRLPLSRAHEAFTPQEDDVKVVIDL